MSDDLKNFKIQDAVKKPVERPRAAAPGASSEEASEPESIGFPFIEAQVEADGPWLDGMRERHAVLDEMGKNGASPKEKASGKKAALGYQRALELLDHLLATKAQMLNPEPEEG